VIVICCVLDHRTAHYEFNELCYHFVKVLKNFTEPLIHTENRQRERVPMYLIDAEHFFHLKIFGLIDSTEWNFVWKNKQQQEVALKKLGTNFTVVPYTHIFPQTHPKETAQLIFNFLQ
jgi:hypothetical protein